ncbi:class I adenylate-forming enzyme family protein [Zavarzinia sp. CC-PAN008]|uniref:class I adenylate-forming enzyme family protein n=1 Tax=Zavarzinia sp. CC-PAN008 TaxID=3243332 RepID=UPI003F749498
MDAREKAETANGTLAPVADRRAALAARMPLWDETTLDSSLQHLAQSFADRPLVITDAVSWTYADVIAKGERLARGLAGRGVRAGQRVALLMANHPDFVPLAYAIWRLGAVLIPVNFAFRTAELGYVLRQSQASALITMGTYRDLDYLAMLDALAPGWDTALPQAPLPHLMLVVQFQADRPGVPDVDAVEDAGAVAAPLPESPAGPHDPAVIMYTSGTTGPPKGVVQSHDALLRSSFACAYHRAYEDGRRIVFALPLYHAFGLVVGVLAAPWVGGAIIPQLQFDPSATLAAIARHRATDALFVPTMALAVLERAAVERHDLSSLVSVLSGAAPTPVRIWQELIDRLGLAEVTTGYGMTELTSSTVYTHPGDPLLLVEQTVGTAILGGPAGDPARGGRLVEYRTCDPLTGEMLADGAEGELVCRSPTATSGYFAMPELTAALFLPGGWLRSGDLGRVRPDGYLELTGRSKELYKTGGELVAPREVEDILNAHPDVAQSFVIGGPDERWGEIGAAWIVPTGGTTPDAQALVDWCRSRLARYKQPRHVFFCAADDLPRTPTGKVQKFELVKRARALLADQVSMAAVPPTTSSPASSPSQ